MDQKKLLAIVLAVVVAALLFFLSRKPSALESSAAHVTPTIEKKWEFTAGGKIFGALALADDGTLYAAAEDGFVYALDGSGTQQWKTYVGPTRSAPAVGADGAIYIANNNGRVMALNHSGSVRWTAEVYQGNTWGENGSAVGRDYLYVPSRGDLCAIRLSNGQVDWQSRWGGEQWGAVTLLPDGTTLSPGRGRLNNIDSRGEVAWQYPALTDEATRNNGGYPPPGIFFVTTGIAVDSNRTLYAGIGREKLVAMAPNGAPKWELKTVAMEMNRATPVISADGTIFFAGADAKLYALDSFGTTKWSLALDGPIPATPVLAEDGTIFVMHGRFLSAISPDGKVLSQVIIGSGAQSSPTLAPDGTVYVATYDAKVIAYTGGHGGLMNSPWPKYQADLANTGAAHSF
ncbi:MAG TPA: PQQ-binding-like beta-propeller repeat protein [Candidatus Acidoferrum sp.]